MNSFLNLINEFFQNAHDYTVVAYFDTCCYFGNVNEVKRMAERHSFLVEDPELLKSAIGIVKERLQVEEKYSLALRDDNGHEEALEFLKALLHHQ